jgi:hypothetical protein
MPARRCEGRAAPTSLRFSAWTWAARISSRRPAIAPHAYSCPRGHAVMIHERAQPAADDRLSLGDDPVFRLPANRTSRAVVPLTWSR